jgi:hypothetical protein
MSDTKRYSSPGADGLDMFRKTGGNRRWGKGISDADYNMLSIGSKMTRAAAIKRGEQWPPAVAPTAQEQFAANAKIGQHPTRR